MDLEKRVEELEWKMKMMEGNVNHLTDVQSDENIRVNTVAIMKLEQNAYRNKYVVFFIFVLIFVLGAFVIF